MVIMESYIICAYKLATTRSFVCASDVARTNTHHALGLLGGRGSRVMLRQNARTIIAKKLEDLLAICNKIGLHAFEK